VEVTLKQQKTTNLKDIPITAGSLRERVKKGEIKAREVLKWLETQPGPHSEEFIRWLKRVAEDPSRVKHVKGKERSSKQKRNGRDSSRRTTKQRRKRRTSADHASAVSSTKRELKKSKSAGVTPKTEKK
jgi:hypothetical protein